MKTRSILLLAAAVLGCDGEVDRTAEAAVFVANDLLQAGPPGLDPHLGGEWETGDRQGDTIPVPLLRRLENATGLPIASPRMVSGSASPMAVLYLFRPEETGDTVQVRAGWIGYPEGGRGSGEEYEYVLHCPRSCVLVVRHGPVPVG